MGRKKNPSACKYCGKSLGEKGSKFSATANATADI